MKFLDIFFVSNKVVIFASGEGTVIIRSRMKKMMVVAFEIIIIVVFEFFVIGINDGVIGIAFGCRVHASGEGTVIIILERNIMVVVAGIINVVFGIVIVIVIVVVVVVIFEIVIVAVVAVVVNCEGISTYATLSGQTLSSVRVLDTAVGTISVML